MSVLCLLVGILLCSAELFCDKLLTQQQLQQPLFLRLSFCHSLYSTCLLPFHSCLGMVCQLFFFPCLLCHILSYYVSSLFLAFSILTCPILSYPRCFYIYSYFFAYTIASVFLPILFYPILCIPSCFFAYPICSCLFASIFAYPVLFYLILSCPMLSYHLFFLFSSYPFKSSRIPFFHIICYPILCFCIPSGSFAYSIFSCFLHPPFLSFPFLSFPFLSFPFLFLSVPLPVLSFHIFSHPFFICLFYLIISTAVTSLLLLCIPFSSSLFFLLFLSCWLGFYFRNY